MQDLWEHEEPIADLLADGVPSWIVDQEITGRELEAIIQGGCASGAYMPAVTYHQAIETMSEHGNDILQYIDDNYGETPTVPEGESWQGINCFYLSLAVELWAIGAQEEAIKEMENGT